MVLNHLIQIYEKYLFPDVKDNLYNKAISTEKY